MLKSKQIPVPAELVDRLEAEFAPCNHPVFQLTPPLFHECAVVFYARIGSPVITFKTFWDTYHQLLQCFLQDSEIHDEAMSSLISSQHVQAQEVERDLIPLIEGMRELQQGDQVIGCPNEDDGDGSDYGWFTDESNESDTSMNG